MPRSCTNQIDSLKLAPRNMFEAGISVSENSKQNKTSILLFSDKENKIGP